MRDALLGLALAAEADEGFALGVQSVLLAEGLRCGDGAAGGIEQRRGRDRGRTRERAGQAPPLHLTRDGRAMKSWE